MAGTDELVDDYVGDGVEDEIEILSAIFPAEFEHAKEVVSVGDKRVRVDVFRLRLKPLDGDDTGYSLVAAAGGFFTQLRLVLVPRYPEQPPRIELGEARGLDDAQRASLISLLQSRCMEPDVKETNCTFVLAETAREHLAQLAVGGGTGGDSTGGVDGDDALDDCAICFTPMSSESGYVTPCFHGFHIECLARWLWTLQCKASTDSSARADDVSEAGWAEKLSNAATLLEKREGELQAIEKETSNVERDVKIAKKVIEEDKTKGASEAATKAKATLSAGEKQLKQLQTRKLTATDKIAAAQSTLRDIERKAAPTSAAAESYDCPSCRTPVDWSLFREQYDAWVAAVGQHEFPADFEGEDADLQAAIAASAGGDMVGTHGAEEEKAGPPVGMTGGAGGM